MSSILKALKKLESQNADQNHVRFHRPKNHSLNIGHEQINGHPRFKKRYVIIFTGLVFVVGAWLILSQKLHEKIPELITKEEIALEKPARLPENSAFKPDRAKKELSSRKDGKKIEPIARAAKAATPSSYKSQRNSAVLLNEKTPPRQKVRKETVAKKHIEKPEQNTKTDWFASTPVRRSNQTKIELQAIAWSKDPKSRLAVINGLILKERESIDNVIVLHIGRDAVVFRKGQEEWKQMFGF